MNTALAGAQTLQLIAGSIATGTIAPGESKRWLLEMPPASYAKVTLVAEDGALKLTLRDASGAQVITSSSAGGSGGTALLAWVSKAKETFTVEAALSASDGPVRNVTVTIQELRAAVPGDAERTEPLSQIVKLFADAQKLLIGRQYAAAIPLLEQAREQGRLLNDPRVQASALYRLGMAHYYQDDRHPADDLLRQALVLQRKEKQSFETALTLNNLAALDRLTGYCSRSLDEVKEALQIREVLRDPRGIAYGLLGLADSYYCLGDSQAALDTDLRVVEKWRELKDAANEAESQNTLGVVYLTLGEWDRAREALQKSLALWTGANNPKGQGEANYNLGLLRMSLGDPSGALSFYQKASAFMTAAKDNRGMAYVLEGMGEAQSKLGHHAVATELLRRAQSMLEQVGDRYEEAYVWQAIGDELADGRAAYEKALAMAVEVGDRHGQAISLYRMAQLAGKTRDDTSASQYIDQAIALVESTRGSVLDAAHRASYLASKRGIYEFKVSLLMRGNRVVEAFETSEAAHARALLDEVAGASGLEKKEIAAEESVVAELQTHPTPELVAEKQTLDASIRRVSPSQAAFELPVIASLQQIQSSLTAEDVLVEYLTGEHGSYGWAITRDRVSGFALPKREVLAKDAGQLTQALTSRLKRPAEEGLELRAARLAKVSLAAKQTAAALSAEILGPIPVSLRKPRMILVTDGPLANIPFSVLPIGFGKQIVEIPSASVLMAKRAGGSKKQFAPFLVIADPKSEPGSYGPLAFSRQEGKDLSDMAAPETVEFRHGSSASSTLFQREEIQSFGLIHISSHAVVNDRTPDQSAILLSDGWLNAASLRKVHLGATLVTLSACDTAAGKAISGEGLMSLQRSFLYSGAHAVLSARWAVDDEATAKFMHLFYAGLLRKHLSLTAALQKAQQQMRSEPRWSDPYYWAAFTLQGDWQ